MPSSCSWIFPLLLCLHLALAKVQYKTKCSDDTMEVELRRTDDINAIYLEGLKHYPDPACKPVLFGHQAVFRLSLNDVFKCGITRVINQATGLRTFYHRIIIETDNKDAPKEAIQVKCLQAGNHTIFKRNVLPAGFQEPIDLDITTSLTGRAPQPKLQVGVRQAGKLVTGELNVNPGTPLQMEIYLDKKSAPVYGLLVSYMLVSDTKTQEETIIFNGCSVDPYLFENFNTVDGDFLSAKFRAFKFPDSTYVQFKGTVNVCLDKCRGIECSNGQIGFGRRKREVPSMPPDPNKVFEVSITSFIKVDYKEGEISNKVKLDIGDAPVAEEKNVTSNSVTDTKQELKLEGEEIREGFVYTVIEETNSCFQQTANVLMIILTFVLCVYH
ncbi:unnamed protein product [Nezara viridula]|uniref:ZP domain-containing protein n=1 Tax=Nezara viridula TaxID=85310 RepID=A0A9P0HGY6_NEZVI|nr:unnamed protein product [Nezara viridula]